jgi:hypothetical protein
MTKVINGLADSDSPEALTGNGAGRSEPWRVDSGEERGRDCGLIRPVKAYAVSRWLHYQPTGERSGGDGVPPHRMGHRSISLIEQLQGSAAAAFD